MEKRAKAFCSFQIFLAKFRPFYICAGIDFASELTKGDYVRARVVKSLGNLGDLVSFSRFISVMSNNSPRWVISV